MLRMDITVLLLSYKQHWMMEVRVGFRVVLKIAQAPGSASSFGVGIRNRVLNANGSGLEYPVSRQYHRFISHPERVLRLLGLFNNLVRAPGITLATTCEPESFCSAVPSTSIFIRGLGRQGCFNRTIIPKAEFFFATERACIGRYTGRYYRGFFLSAASSPCHGDL